MDSNDEGPKRIRLELRKERKACQSNVGEKRRERNLKYKETTHKIRGRLDFYCNNETEKIEMFNKLDKIKLFLGEGKFNTVSTYAVLHRLCDFFINVNLPGEDKVPEDVENVDFEPMYQYCDEEAARSDEIFVGCLSSVQKLVAQVQCHDKKCQEKLLLSNNTNIHGTMSVDLKCKESHGICWTSSPHMKNGKFLAGAKLSHGYFSSGILPNQFQKFCEASGLGELGETYVNEYMVSYQGVVETLSHQSMERALESEIAMSAALLPDDEPMTGINVLTDARHCWRKNAKFTDVVCLGGATNKCLHVSTVTKDDDTSSQRHELIGVKRIYEYLDSKDCPVNIHAHDNNSQINKYVREEQSPTENALDTWHVVKGIAKKARKITSGSKSTRGLVWHEELSDKAAAIKTHIFHSMKNCQNDENKLRANILCFIDHYQGYHDNCMQTSRCKTDQNYESSKYIIKDEKAISVLTSFLKSLPVFKQADKFKYCMDTHYVESFNNFVLQFVDKRICFGFDSYKLRINFAILDWNENVNREKTSEREMPYKRDASKTYKVPVLKRKSTGFKEEIWNKWLTLLCN